MLTRSVFFNNSSVITEAAFWKYSHELCTWVVASSSASPGWEICIRKAIASTMLKAAYHPESLGWFSVE